jgi:DNA-directed RNA polymerase III subunit RPC6
LGIWKKSLVQHANLHENSVTKALKELMNKGLVKEFKTSKNTAKRMYILHNLEPSEKSTGGSFYRDGELDEGLINVLNDFIVEYIERKTWAEVKPTHTPRAKETEKRKRSAAASTAQPVDADKEEKPLFRPPLSYKQHPIVPQPETFDDYPSVEDLLNVIDEKEVLKDMTLTLDDLNQLVRQLVYDDRLEEMSEGHYRSVRRVWDRNAKDAAPLPLVGPADMNEEGYAFGNGLTQSPCGRCPIAKDCRIGGIISPETCEYMAKWLAQLF